MLTKTVQKSFLYQSMRFLVTDNVFKTSSVVGLFKKLYIPHMSEVFLLLSLLASWYEGLYAQYLSFSYLSIIFIFLAYLVADKDKIFFRKAHLWYLLFLLVSALSAVVAVFGGANSGLVFSGFTLFFQFFLVMITAQTITSRLLFLKSMIWLASPIALIGLFQFVSGQKTSSLWVSSAEKEITTRAFGFFGSPNVLGILLALMIVVCFGIYYMQRRKIYLAFTGLYLGVLFLTYSRTAWLALAVASIFAIYHFKKRLLLYTPIPVFLLLLVGPVRKRIETVFTQSYLFDSYLDGRIWSAINGLYIWRAHPIFGTGPGTYGGQLASTLPSPVYLEGIQKGYTALYFTDNQYLEILVQTGVLGLVAFMLFLVSFFVLAYGGLKKKGDPICLIAIMTLIVFCIAGLLSNVLEFGAIVIPVAIIFGVAISETKKENSHSI